jgi:hypothetical protein
MTGEAFYSVMLQRGSIDDSFRGTEKMPQDRADMQAISTGGSFPD